MKTKRFLVVLVAVLVLLGINSAYATLSFSPGTSGEKGARIFGDKVVAKGTETLGGSTTDILIIYDISSHVTDIVDKGNPYNSCDIGQNYVVYSYQGYVYAYNMSTKNKQLIASNAATQTEIRIAEGKNKSYALYYNQGGGLVLYDLISNSSSIIANNSPGRIAMAAENGFTVAYDTTVPTQVMISQRVSGPSQKWINIPTTYYTYKGVLSLEMNKNYTSFVNYANGIGSNEVVLLDNDSIYSSSPVISNFLPQNEHILNCDVFIKDNILYPASGIQLVSLVYDSVSLAGNGFSIYLWQNGVKTAIKQSQQKLLAPKIYGNNIIYYEQRGLSNNDPYDLRVYNIKTGTDKFLMP